MSLYIYPAHFADEVLRVDSQENVAHLLIAVRQESKYKTIKANTLSLDALLGCNYFL